MSVLARAKSRVRQSPWIIERALLAIWCIVRLEWPYPVAHAKIMATTRHPRTYSDKVRYKMARDRRPILTMWADRLAVREYVASKVGTDLLLDVYSRAQSARSLDWQSLPREYVLKVNHGCGGMIIITEGADIRYRLPAPGPRTRWTRHLVHPESMDRSATIALLDSWLTIKYGWGMGSRWEWAYQAIVPTVYVEEFVGDHGPARNLKIHCIAGEPLVGTVTHLAQDLMGDVPEERFRVDDAPKIIDSVGISKVVWRRIEECSRILASETDFVRLDWLLSGKGASFGEFTNYPSAGRGAVMGTRDMTGPDTAAWLSDKWVVPARYK